MKLPRFFPVRQSFPRPRVDDIVERVQAELDRVIPAERTSQGAQIGITVGSRGIANIAEITRAAVDFFRSRGAEPFIIPSMGSHGGATAEGQAHLLAHYGVTEEGVGAPVRAAMETEHQGTTAEGVEVYLAKTAVEADGVLLLNRVKPHTDYKGPIESGLAKICAIGLGKLDGATEYHSRVFDIGLGDAIRSAAGLIVSGGKIAGGLAILENAYHDTADLIGVSVDGFFEQEAEILKTAFSLMGRLPLMELDVLYCRRLGKNISGAGMDTNIIGRRVYGYIPGTPWMEGMPAITRICLSDISDESDGNAVGMGLAEYITRRFRDKIDHAVTKLNCMTANSPAGGRMPIVVEDDRELLEAGIRTSPRREDGPRIALIRDTLSLENVYLSEACLPLIEGREDLEVVEEPSEVVFDDAGHLQLSF